MQYLQSAVEQSTIKRGMPVLQYHKTLLIYLEFVSIIQGLERHLLCILWWKDLLIKNQNFKEKNLTHEKI